MIRLLTTVLVPLIFGIIVVVGERCIFGTKCYSKELIPKKADWPVSKLFPSENDLSLEGGKIRLFLLLRGPPNMGSPALGSRKRAENWTRNRGVPSFLPFFLLNLPSDWVSPDRPLPRSVGSQYNAHSGGFPRNYVRERNLRYIWKFFSSTKEEQAIKIVGGLPGELIRET